tara:strand:+ start:572 stop:682 length:111 start_codon:yes stop_codon:yes gene_type:complete
MIIQNKNYKIILSRGTIIGGENAEIFSNYFIYNFIK